MKKVRFKGVIYRSLNLSKKRIILAILPKLVDFDWRVDIKMNSNLAMGDESERSGQQTCILQLKVFLHNSNEVY